jgi:cation diffusion facilitator CzcD-associated flavoprotein CzcO
MRIPVDPALLAPDRERQVDLLIIGAGFGGLRLFMPLTGGFPAYAERCAEVAERGYEGFALA